MAGWIINSRQDVAGLTSTLLIEADLFACCKQVEAG